jgi:hypothetical protein
VGAFEVWVGRVRVWEVGGNCGEVACGVGEEGEGGGGGGGGVRVCFGGFFFL